MINILSNKINKNAPFKKGSDSNRLVYIDVTKGYLKIMVLFHHILWILIDLQKINNEVLFALNSLQRLFLCFFMPCFFIISGYCSSFKGNTTAFIIKGFKQLIIPNCFFSILHMIITDNVSIERYLSIIINYGGYFWFLSAIFCSRVLLFILKKKIANSNTLIIILLLLSILTILAKNYKLITHNYWYLYHAFSFTIYLEIGQRIRYIINKSQISKPLLLSSLIFVFVIIFCIVFNNDIPYITAKYHCTIQLFPCHLILSLLGSISFIIIIKYFHILHFRVVNILGRESLIVFCTHLMFLTPFLSYFSIEISMFNVLQSCLFIIISLMMAIVFCLTCIYIFNKKYIRIFIGKF